MGMSLRIEVFAQDPARSAEFYQRVLGFSEETRKRSSSGQLYVAVARDTVRIGIATAWVDTEPASRNLPAGTEIVLEVDDLDAERARVAAAGWLASRDLQRQEWGLTDFRLSDPDGYYIRLTGRD